MPENFKVVLLALLVGICHCVITDIRMCKEISCPFSYVLHLHPIFGIHYNLFVLMLFPWAQVTLSWGTPRTILSFLVRFKWGATNGEDYDREWRVRGRIKGSKRIQDNCKTGTPCKKSWLAFFTDSQWDWLGNNPENFLWVWLTSIHTLL